MADQTKRRLPFKPLLAVMCGVFLLLTVALMTVNSDLLDVYHTMNMTMQYLERQCATYDDFTCSDTVKSLVWLTDKANYINYDISDKAANGVCIDSGVLMDYTDAQRLTGIILMGADSEPECWYLGDGGEYDMWKELCTDSKSADIARYPEKKLMARIHPEGGFYYDYTIVSREDRPGIMLCYFRQAENLVEENQLSIGSIFSGYGLAMDGVAVVTDGNNVLGSNDGELVGNSVLSCGVLNSFATNGVTEGIQWESSGNRLWIGGQTNTKNYFIYVYFPAEAVLLRRVPVLIYALLGYLLLLAVLFVVRRGGKNERLERREYSAMVHQQRAMASARKSRRSNAKKTDFMRKMNHDIRTPINGIRGMVEIAGHYPDDPEKLREYLGKIWQSSDYMLDLVNNFADIEELENGTVVPDVRTFSLNSLFDEIRSLTTPRAQERGVKLDIARISGRYDLLIGSPALLKRLFVSLISNAVKFNRRGGNVVVGCREVSGSNDRVVLEFSVMDTGKGMSLEFQKHMFEPFAQEDSASDDPYGGTGLGLPICRRIVALMKGTIDCTSVQNEGTTVFVTIPFRIAQERSGRSSGSSGKGAASLRGHLVLVAEDNDLNMEVADFALRHAGANVLKAYNGREAVEMFRTSDPGSIDVILMDLVMPEMDGFEAARNIRALDRSDAAAVPIIALTANVFREDLEKALAAGMNARVTKPVDISVIAEVVAKYTDKTKEETKQ